MGDAKRKREAAVMQGIADAGSVVEMGWLTHARLTGIAPDDRAGREAFYSGANYLFMAMLAMLEAGEDATPDDMRRMDALHRELGAFEARFRAKYEAGPPPPPSAGLAAAEFAALSPEQRLGDAPIEAQQAEVMRAAAMGIDGLFNGDAKGADRRTGFVLMTFPYGDHSGRCNYMSNGADRRDVLTLMREMIARFEGQPDMSGRA